MSNLTKQEIITNLKDKISQFKSNFSKNKESRKDSSSDLNFEINRDALKLFYRNKSPDEVNQEEQECPGPEPPSESEPKQDKKMDEDIYDIKKILNDDMPRKSNTNMNKNKKEKISDENNEIGAKIKNNFNGEMKFQENLDIFKTERNTDMSQMNNKKKDDSKKSLNQIGSNNNTILNNNGNANKNNKYNFEYNTANSKINNAQNNPKENISLAHVTLNNLNYNDFNFGGMVKSSKNLDKREKSAPKITLNQNNNNYLEKPLTGKNNENNLNINLIFNFNNNGFNPKKTNKTEELYQQLLSNFNINNSRKNTSFYNDYNNNYNYNKENKANKSYGQINLKDINLFHEINPNFNSNKNNNYMRNELNLDHLKNLYNKKTEDNRRPTQYGLKTKMEIFYQELNDYKNSNNHKKEALNNLYNNDKYLNSKRYGNNTHYTDYINNWNKKINCQSNEQNNNKVSNGCNLSYSEIHAFKQYIKNMSKEEINNLSYNIKSELKEIFNILYQKFNQ